MAPAPHDDARQRINLSWLIKLRWCAVIGQFVVVMAVWALMHIALPLQTLLTALAVTAASNLALLTWARSTPKVPEALLGGVVATDILLLTVMLYCTGGCTNPFNFLYLVHIALAAATLRARFLVALVALAFTCFVTLFFYHEPLAMAADGRMALRLYNQGMAVAFALAATFIVYFVQRVTRALIRREGELAEAREVSARNERLTSLATLAAGAAHELATPLATIAVVAKELERGLLRDAPSGELCEDAKLIRAEVHRCRQVLVQMASDAGAAQGEPFSHLTADGLMVQALQDLPQRERVQVSWAALAKRASLNVPERSIAQAVRAVVKNALEASEAPVEVRVGLEARRCAIVVQDRGQGMPPEILAHVSEPFFTTKAPGVGMGLGLFLTRTVVERLGGSLELHSMPQRGTTATLRLPLHEEGELV